MDVRCARCGIEYEFDDALISERGTMVRCTECGHQFRVHPSHVIPGAPDEWRVITQDGQSIVYVTLRELQQGITQGQVGRDATLIRGGGPPRPLGTIAELDPFFPTPAVETKQQSTLTGVAPPSLAPEPKPARPSGRTPIARIGLNTVQVSASGVALDASQALARPRKTTLGIGAQVPKQSQIPGSSDTQAGEYGSEITASFEEPAAAHNSRSSTSALRPAFRSPKIAEAAALAKAVTAKSAARKPETSEPPTARKAEAAPQETQAKRPVVPRRAMTPAGGIVATQDAEVEAPSVGGEAPQTLSPGEPLEPSQSTAEGPSATDPPPAQRHVRDETQFLSDDDQTAPIANSHVPASELEPTTDTAASNAPRDESLPLVFEAESPPLELPGDRASQAPAAAPVAVKAQSVEPDAGTFMPTVPPRRLLTQLDSVEPETVRKRSSKVGVGLMLALLVVLIALGTLWWRSRAVTPSVSAPPTAPTLEDYLSRASDALRAGDLVHAHDQLQASQTAGGRDPRWMALTARYDVMRADMNWLAVHLADPTDAPHLEALKRELVENTAQASRALKAIEPLGLNAAELAAARLDSARLRGELDQARKDAELLNKAAIEPGMAYSLASLEFASEHPNTKNMFEWLGVARAADSGLGRAPALLVLACVASERLDSARAELQRLKSASRSHPLLPEIEWFVNRSATPRVAAADSAAPAASAATPVAADAPSPQATATESMADITKEGDFRLRLRRGVEALSHGELTRADLFFRSVIAERPNDTEALTGLGDVARRRNNTTSAMSYYQKVLSSNGQYLPALSALGDLKWKSGDRAGAAVHYRRILEQVSDSSSYGQTAAQRLREMNEGATKPSGDGASANGAGKPDSAGKAK